MPRARALAALVVVVLGTAVACGQSLEGSPRPSTREIGDAGTIPVAGTAPVITGTRPSAPQQPPTEDTVVPGTFEVSGPDTTTDADPAATDPDPGVADDATPPVTAAYPVCNETKGNLQHFTYNSEVMRIVHPVEGYYVYTPPCYGRDAARRYPSIWLLHGAQRTETQWANIGFIDTANQLIANGEIPPVIIVLMDGISAQGEYTAPPGKIQPFDYYLLSELKPRVQRAFRTLNHRAYRAIGGISRGGEWALLEAGRHPDVFGAVGGHSPAVGSPTNPGPQLAPQLAGRGLRIWLDVGTSDSLAGNVASLDASLNGLHADHEYHPQPGAHEESYWSTHAADYLRWYTEPWKTGTGR